MMVEVQGEAETSITPQLPALPGSFLPNDSPTETQETLNSSTSSSPAFREDSQSSDNVDLPGAVVSPHAIYQGLPNNYNYESGRTKEYTSHGRATNDLAAAQAGGYQHKQADASQNRNPLGILDENGDDYVPPLTSVIIDESTSSISQDQAPQSPAAPAAPSPLTPQPLPPINSPFTDPRRYGARPSPYDARPSPYDTRPSLNDPRPNLYDPRPSPYSGTGPLLGQQIRDPPFPHLSYGQRPFIQPVAPYQDFQAGQPGPHTYIPFVLPPGSPENRPASPPFLRGQMPSEQEIDLIKTYREGALYTDGAQVANWDRDMDMILVFAALFSAVLTAFLIESYQRLEPDQEELAATSLQKMTAILASIAMNQISPNSSAYQFEPDLNEEEPFHPLLADLWINGMWFLSLSFSLAAAMSAMLVKQWLQQYLMGLNASSTSDQTYHTRRQLRYNNLLAWRVPTIIAALPLLLYTAVILFLAGLIVLVWNLNQALGIVITAFLGAVAVFDIGAVLMPLFYPSCPYKTSFIAGFRRVIYYAIFGWWDLCFQLATKVSQVYGERWSVLAEQLATRKPHYSPSFVSVETEHVKLRKEELEFDGLVWMYQNSHPELTNYTLQAIPDYQATGMPRRLLRHDILERLHDRAKVKLPDDDDEFWTSAVNLQSYMLQMQMATPYLRSLIYVWMQDDYLFKLHPPAVTERDALSMHEAPLLPGWLKLWRSLYDPYADLMQEKKMSIRHEYTIHDASIETEWASRGVNSLDEFAFVVCAETLYSHLHPTRGTPSLPARADLVNILDLAKDTMYLRLSSQSLNLLLDTLAHSLARLLETEEERERILLVLFAHGARFLDKAIDAAWVKIIHCLRLLTFDDLESRKQVMLHPRSKSRLSALKEEMCEDLQAFYESFSRSNFFSGRNADTIMTTALRWLCISIFVQKYPLRKYHRFLIKLPPAHASMILSTIRALVISHSPKHVQPEGLNRLCGLLQGWYIEQATPTKLRIEIVDILTSILLHDFDSDATLYEKVLQKILGFFTGILSSTNRFRDYAAANHMSRVCASLFAYSFSLTLASSSSPLPNLSHPVPYAGPRSTHGAHVAQRYYDDSTSLTTRRTKLILEKMHEYSVIKACTRFLSSPDRRTTETVIAWDQLLVPWKAALGKVVEGNVDMLNRLNVEAYEETRTAVGVFPTRSRTPKNHSSGPLTESPRVSAPEFTPIFESPS